MIYSPSQTKSYLECPTKRMLQQEGWQSRVVDLRSWVAWIGHGVHAGLASCGGGRNPHPDSEQIGQECFAEYLLHAVQGGRIIPNTFYPGEAKAHIERCLHYAMTHDILPAGFEVERVEQSLGPDSGNCILDVVGKRNGKPTFIDWKVKWKCKLEYVDQELEKYRYDWKEARHYPWALSQVTGQQVVEYTVVMFILQPFKVVSRTYQVNWKMVERWVECVKGLYEVMEGKIQCGRDYAAIAPWQTSMCFPPIGLPCEYLDACWAYNLDREKMRVGGLVQVQRLNKQIVADSHEEQQGGVL